MTAPIVLNTWYLILILLLLRYYLIHNGLLNTLNRQGDSTNTQFLLSLTHTQQHGKSNK